MPILERNLIHEFKQRVGRPGGADNDFSIPYRYLHSVAFSDAGFESYRLGDTQAQAVSPLGNLG